MSYGEIYARLRIGLTHNGIPSVGSVNSQVIQIQDLMNAKKCSNILIVIAAAGFACCRSYATSNSKLTMRPLKDVNE